MSIITFSRIAFAGAMLSIAACAALPLYAQSSTACNPTDSWAEHIEDRVLTLSSDTSADAAALRVKLGLTEEPNSDVAIVSDSSICASAVTALKEHAPATSPSSLTRAYVVRVGTSRYVTFSDRSAGSGLREAIVLDATFAYLERWLL